MVNRRDFLKSSAAAGAALSLGGRRLFGQEAATKPNFILFMCDQMRQPRWFPATAELPNFSRLKERGLEFTRHFASAVPCSPSRACLFTGLHSAQNGVIENVLPEFQEDLNPQIPMLGQLFRKAGYQTHYFGKWHLSRKKQMKKQGGLEAYGFEYHSTDTAGPGLTTDPGCAAAACDWLLDPNNHNQPWFLVVSLINPHDICGYNTLHIPEVFIDDEITSLPANFTDDLTGKPRCHAEYRDLTMPKDMAAGKENLWLNYINYYYFLMRKMDNLLGKVLDTLDSAAQTGNTVFIFTSDHGEIGGAHRLAFKGPFIYDENTNIPLVISWPGKIQPLTQTNALCQNVDLFPTLAALLGFDPKMEFPYLPGHSLFPVLLEPKTAAVNYHLLFSFAENVAMVKKRELAGEPWIQSPHQIRSIRERNWAYARYFDPESSDQDFELYDLFNDPYMMKNLAHDRDYRATRQEMAEKLFIAESSEMAPMDLAKMKI